MRFGYNVADRRDLTVEGNASQRESALKQWYAWWYRTHAGDFQSAIDEEDDETLFMTEAEKAARKAAQEAAGKGGK